MLESAFSDKSSEPGDDALMECLGRSSMHWKAIVDSCYQDLAATEQAWGYTSTAGGWSLRLKAKKRAIIYLTPCRRHFVAGLVLGGKAIKAARSAGLSQVALDLIDGSPKYAEGTGIRFEVRTKCDREIILALASIKMAH